MITGLLVLVIIGIIYYSTHKIPPEPIFKQERYVEENDFWGDMSEEDLEEVPKATIMSEELPKKKLPVKAKKRNRQKEQGQSKTVKRRRKRRKIAKKSRQQNRS
jgi:hypothetical protein